MDRQKELFKLVIETAASHVARVREGHELLERGRSLSEMTASITGPSNDALLERRDAFVYSLASMTPCELRTLRTKTEQKIIKYLDSEFGGTSELEWERNEIQAQLGV